MRADGAGLCAQVTWPTLCLSGAEDVLTLPGEVAATAALIAGAVHECIPGAGHSLLLESKHAYDRVVAFAPLTPEVAELAPRGARTDGAWYGLHQVRVAAPTACYVEVATRSSFELFVDGGMNQV